MKFIYNNQTLRHWRLKFQLICVLLKLFPTLWRDNGWQVSFSSKRAFQNQLNETFTYMYVSFLGWQNNSKEPLLSFCKEKIRDLQTRYHPALGICGNRIKEENHKNLCNNSSLIEFLEVFQPEILQPAKEQI